MKRLQLLLILLIPALSIFAQKQANYWYFGINAGLNFGLGVPVPLTNGALNTGEGCSSISTPAGVLQCYTDGSFVYDRNNNQMPHGNGLLGNWSSAQSGIIVPKPASTTQYYIFTVDAYEDNLADGLCYSRVDMTLNNGLGDVVTTEKNISLLPLTCEKVTAVGHSNGISIWVITHQWGTDAFYAYQITTAGVDINPVISHAGAPLMGNMQQAKGYLKVSPDGSKIAMANNTAFTVGIFNFDHATGVITHLVTDNNFVNPGGNDPGGPYGVEFSANSTRLYISEWKANRRISQYDLSSGDPATILSSRVTVASVGQGSYPYEYYWTSVPAGYTSTEVNPVVEPIVSTVYSVSITDGYTYVSGSANVVVNPAPVINLGPDATVCVFDTLTLDAGNPGASYIWSNGSTEKIIHVATTGIGFDFKTISVTVTTPEGCTAFDDRTIIFDFAACNGLADPIRENGFHIYPNPGNGIIHIENNAGIENCLVSVADIFGREVIKNQEIDFSGMDGPFYLDLTSYQQGLYLIRLTENGNHLVSIKYLLKR